MNGNLSQFIHLFMVFIPLLIIAGLYCVIVSRNLIRTIIGLEILTKGVTLLIIVAGYLTGRLALAQTFVITLIVVEVVVMVVAAGIILNVFKHAGSLETRNVGTLKG